jgi:hypothetical protein
VFEPLFQVWANGVGGTTAEVLSHSLDRWFVALQEQRVGCSPHILTLDTARVGKGMWLLQTQAI